MHLFQFWGRFEFLNTYLVKCMLHVCNMLCIISNCKRLLHKNIIQVTFAGWADIFLGCYNFQRKINTTGRESSRLYSQRDRSLHCGHEVRGVQLVLEDRFLHPFQQGQQVQVVPIHTQMEKTSWCKPPKTLILLVLCSKWYCRFFIIIECFGRFSTHSLSSRSSRSSGTLVTRLTLKR